MAYFTKVQRGTYLWYIILYSRTTHGSFDLRPEVGQLHGEWLSERVDSVLAARVHVQGGRERDVVPRDTELQ